MNFDLEYLEKLAELLHDNDLNEITLEDDERAVSLKREKAVFYAAPQASVSAAGAAIQAQPTAKAEEKKPEPAKKGRPIASPMTGTFYASPSPDEPPFVSAGDNVAAGQVICIIEAMKLMNEIEADISGRIIEICVKNGSSVEAGQILMYVE